MRKLILIFAFSSSLAAQVQIGKNVQIGGTITGGGSPPGGATNNLQYNAGSGLFGGVSFNGIVFNNGNSSPPSALAGSSTVTAVQGTASTGIAGTTGTFVANNLRVTDASGREIDSQVAIEPTSTGGRAITATNIDLGSTASPDPTSAGNVLFWVLPGGNIIHYGRPTGTTATGVYQNSPTQGSLLTADDSLPAVFSNAGLNGTLGHIANGIGFQVATGVGCSPAPNGSCVVTMAVHVAEPDTSYSVLGCMSSGVGGVATFISNPDTTTFTTTSFSILQTNPSSSTPTNAGSVSCLVTHN